MRGSGVRKLHLCEGYGADIWCCLFFDVGHRCHKEGMWATRCWSKCSNVSHRCSNCSWSGELEENIAWIERAWYHDVLCRFDQDARKLCWRRCFNVAVASALSLYVSFYHNFIQWHVMACPNRSMLHQSLQLWPFFAVCKNIEENSAGCSTSYSHSMSQRIDANTRRWSQEMEEIAHFKDSVNLPVSSKTGGQRQQIDHP